LSKLNCDILEFVSVKPAFPEYWGPWMVQIVLEVVSEWTYIPESFFSIAHF